MASKAHAFNHYSLRSAVPRPRRDVWYDSDEPVVLPRSRQWDFNGALLAAALAATGVVVASGYAVYYAGEAPLADTPTMPLSHDWDGDAELPRANALNLLRGPALAVPAVATPESVAEPETNAPSPTWTGHRSERSDYVIDDSVSGAQQRFPQPTPPTPLEAPYPDPLSKPYPNPTTTPPEGVAPPQTSPNTPTPALDPENPY